MLTIHKKASQCNCTQWVKTHCYSGYEFSYALKNNFEILINKGFALRPFGKPLVLTSINFDSLSRKIKNPCLVIKKFKSIKEIFKMQNLKNKKIFTLLIAVALILALSISCKSNEDPKDPVEIPSQYYGTWVYTSTGKDALNLQGSTDSLNIAFYDINGLYLGGPNVGVVGATTVDWSVANVTKNSDTSWSWGDYTFSFSSSTEGTLSYEGSNYPIKK